MKKLIIHIALILIITSCADRLELDQNNQQAFIEPYGWFDLDSKNDTINYEVNIENVILSVLFCETIIIPILLTGDQLYEPVGVKPVNQR